MNVSITSGLYTFSKCDKLIRGDKSAVGVGSGARCESSGPDARGRR